MLDFVIATSLELMSFFSKRRIHVVHNGFIDVLLLEVSSHNFIIF